MTTIFTGILIFVVCALLGLLVIQYAYSSWQSQKLNDNFHLEGPVHKNPSDNFPVIAKTSSTVNKTYSQLISRINSNSNAKKVSDLAIRVFSFIKTVFSNMVKLFKYLISLARPVEDTRHSVKVSKDANKSLFGMNSRVVEDQASNYTKNRQEIIKPVWQDPIREDQEFENIQPISKSTFHKEFTSGFDQKESTLYDDDFATIGLASGSKPRSQTVEFEKEEQKILLRLQDSDLKDYAIWLELGDLYGKYEEHAKQRETYSFVLKNGVGKEKNLAMNKLIAMN